MALPVLTQDMCGRELTFKAEGFLKKEVERKSPIFLSNCKFIDLLLILLVHYFLGKYCLGSLNSKYVNLHFIMSYILPDPSGKFSYLLTGPADLLLGIVFLH